MDTTSTNYTTSTLTSTNYTTSTLYSPTLTTGSYTLSVDPTYILNSSSFGSNPYYITTDEIKKGLDKVTKTLKDLEIKDSNEFKSIKELVPEKVYEFIFYDNTKIKTVREEEDFFDLEYMLSLALAKKLYSKEYTFEGVLSKSYSLMYQKYYYKIIKKGVKLFNKMKKEKAEEEEKKAIKKRQHEKYVRKKKAAKERKRKEQVNIIAEAIRLSKEEG